MQEAVKAAARELARAIAAQPEYVLLRMAEDAVTEDAALQALLAERTRLKDSLRDEMALPEPDTKQIRLMNTEYSRLEKRIRENGLFRRYQICSGDFRALMDQVNQEMQSFLQASPGCSPERCGSCSGCGMAPDGQKEE